MGIKARIRKNLKEELTINLPRSYDKFVKKHEKVVDEIVTETIRQTLIYNNRKLLFMMTELEKAGAFNKSYWTRFQIQVQKAIDVLKHTGEKL